MSRRARIRWFGLAGILVVAGIASAVFVNGTTGQLLALVLISLGGVLATSLVFLEVGLSEDRDLEQTRERERARREARGQPQRSTRRPHLNRMRGSRRRLR
ncbi:MAG TPA: hypothetical protein VMU39_25555 [Solirubrobacteraceae bacterium]|nr:hypothetical protein [Solirubrobacteraceae bacterium]